MLQSNQQFGSLTDWCSPKLSRRGIVDPFDLMALFRAGMAFMAALNLVFALMIFSRHCGTPVRKPLIMLARIEFCMPLLTHNTRCKSVGCQYVLLLLVCYRQAMAHGHIHCGTPGFLSSMCSTQKADQTTLCKTETPASVYGVACCSIRCILE